MNKRVAVVTGGIGGLGTDICMALAQSGRTVIAADLDVRDDRLADFKQRINGYDVHFEAANVADFDACGALVQKIASHHGSLDILVNAAGITRDGTLRKMDRVQWDAVLNVNLDSVFNMCRHAVEGMIDRGFGRVVNISSVNGQTGQFGQTNYSAAKAGMHGFSMALAQEVASKGVTVNTVSPGYIATDMVMSVREDVREKIIQTIPVKRLGKAEEIGSICVWLSGDDAGFTTGAEFSCNGGLHMG